MPSAEFIDYQAIKSKVSITQILEHYGLMGQLRQNGDNITGTCPIDESNGKVAFRASASGNCWNCFNRCSCSGDILDFVSRMEKVSILKAGRLIIEWFDLRFEAPLEREAAPFKAHHAPRPASVSIARDVPSPTVAGPAIPRAGASQMKFQVKRCWEVSDYVDVEAATMEEAIEKAHALPFDYTRVEYVPDSINTDPETDVFQHE